MILLYVRAINESYILQLQHGELHAGNEKSQLLHSKWICSTHHLFMGPLSLLLFRKGSHTYNDR